MSGADLKKIAIVLQAPRFPENIGSAARALWNMGLTDLIVVSPEHYDLTRVQRLATHSAAPVVAAIRIFEALDQALAPFNYVVGTTARRGGERQRVFTPETMARNLIPMTAANRIALVFGPEDRGLTNVELRHMLFTAQQHPAGPIAIRYPRGYSREPDWQQPFETIAWGKARTLREGSRVAVLSLGPLGQQVQDILP